MHEQTLDVSPPYDISVLLVEDDVFFHEQAVAMLAPLSRSLHTAANTRQAQPMLHDDPPDLVLLPARQAVSAADVRADPLSWVVLTCPRDDADMLRRAAAMDSDGLLLTPLSPERLRETLARFAGHARLRRDVRMERMALCRVVDGLADPALLVRSGRIEHANSALLTLPELAPSPAPTTAKARTAGDLNALLQAADDARAPWLADLLAKSGTAGDNGNAPHLAAHGATREFRIAVQQLAGAQLRLVRLLPVAEDGDGATCAEDGIEGPVGVCNRADIMRRLEREERISDGRSCTFSLVMFDLDRFASMVERFGRDAAATVLREVAAQVQENIRDRDVVCHWGGRRFMVLAPGSDLQRATRIAERLRRKIEVHDFARVPEVLTACFGVARFERGEPVPQLLERADTALTHARNSGRNRVVVAPAPDNGR